MTKQKPKRPTHKWAKDQDYWDKLSKEERDWLRRFNSEYYDGGFTNKKATIHPDYLKPDCAHRRYAMTNDAMTNAVYMEEPPVDGSSPDLPEKE